MLSGYHKLRRQCDIRSPITPDMLHRLVSVAPSKVTSHSFRIGAATAAALRGVSND